MKSATLTRRDFLKNTARTGAALVIGFTLPLELFGQQAPPPPPPPPNPF